MRTQHRAIEGGRTFDAMLDIVSRVQAPSALYRLEAQPSGVAKKGQRACPIGIGTGLSLGGVSNSLGVGMAVWVRMVEQNSSRTLFVMGKFRLWTTRRLSVA